MASYKIGGDKR